jgi:hypothetical protein
MVDRQTPSSQTAPIVLRPHLSLLVVVGSLDLITIADLTTASTTTDTSHCCYKESLIPTN